MAIDEYFNATQVPKFLMSLPAKKVTKITVIDLTQDSLEPPSATWQNPRGPPVPTMHSYDYTSDLVAYFRARELNIPSRKYRNRSPQILQRRGLTDWTCMVGVQLGMPPLIVHMAVRMVDFFMDAHRVDRPQLHLLCLVALRLAVKFEGKEIKVANIIYYNFQVIQVTRIYSNLVKTLTLFPKEKKSQFLSVIKH